MAITFQHLVKKPNGDTEIGGTGIRVYTVFGLYETGDTPEYIADEYAVPISAVHEALAYATEHADEMEAIRRADEAAAQWTLSQLPDEFRQEAERVRRADHQVRQEAIRQAKEARHGPSLS